MNKVATFVIYVQIFASAAFALSPYDIHHTPPRADRLKGAIPLSIDATNLTKARIFVSGPNGYTIHPMEREGGKFVAKFFGKDLDGRTYQFQVQGESGETVESTAYSLASDGARSDSQRIEDLKKELSNIITEENSVTSKLATLENVSVNELAQRRDEELAQALIILGKKERELNILKGAKP